MNRSFLKFQKSPPCVLYCAGQSETNLSALWLREKSQDATAVDHHTQQRLFDSHLLDPELQISAIEVVTDDSIRLSFSDGHLSVYDTRTLLSELRDTDPFPVAESWNSSLNIQLIRHDWRRMSEDPAFKASLEAFLRYGFIVLHDVPTLPEQILEVASKFGYLKETNFGKYFEVYSKPSANDLAYRSVRLGPHTDNPYRDPVPGIQLLHCLVNETTGGLSTLVDSLSVVERLRLEDPVGHALLRDTPVRFQFIDQGTRLITRRPMIQTDADGRTLGVHYSPRLDSLPLLDDESTRSFHRARRRLAELFNNSEFELRFKLEPGELMLFDNSRVLHGRTEYDPAEGHRHLQGCYIDLDGPRERFSSLELRTRDLKEVA
ncbi:TauD/TfdA family dioxygenase [Pseudomonas sp. NPDC089422]|uniref:TauD/TfdA family dioxygenase n=1 Tax=Pseudomonas sp. NPDC089422 TaxID=3364466 RepID=UPI0038046C39